MIRKYDIVVLIWIFAVLISGCSRHADNSKASARKIAFKKFLSDFDKLSLPLTMKPGRMSMDHYKKLDSADNVFVKYKDGGTVYLYGILPDTSGCYKVIWFQPADDCYPVLATFTKSGKKIKQEDIGVGGCGVDCGYTCTEPSI